MNRIEPFVNEKPSRSSETAYRHTQPSVGDCPITGLDQSIIASPAFRAVRRSLQLHLAKSSLKQRPGLTLFRMLSAEDRAILDFERAAWREPGPKDQAIEMRLGLTAADYYERLRTLVVGSAALAYDPLTTKRVLSVIEEPTESGLAV